MKSLAKRIPFHIFLFPAYTVLILAANNLGQIQLDVIIRPISYVLLLSVAILFLSWLCLRNFLQAGMLTFTILFFLLTYGHFYNFMQGRVIGQWVIGTHFYLLLLWGLVFLTAAYFFVIRITSYQEITLILNIITLILVSVQIGTIIIYETKPQSDSQHAYETYLHPQQGSLPDVYFIILDKYGRSDAIKSLYSYDNSEFIEGLEALGFWVADCARSNYSFTVMSLSSQLNMAYIEDLTDEPNLKTTTALIRNNHVHQMFDELGYTTIAFDMGFTWGNMKHFDYYFDQKLNNTNSLHLSPFEIMYLKSTLGVLMFEAELDIAEQMTLTDIEQKAFRTQLILEYLPEITSIPGPKFIHAHLITPHPPYIFNADGTLNPNFDQVKPTEGYRSQLAFIEPRILNVIEQILDNSKTPPIIILQGDHGFGKKYVTSVLLALYLPNNGVEGLYEDMTLVNVFPHIFNTYFGAEIDYLPDLSYTRTDNWYESVPLPEWNPNCKDE